MENRAGGPLRFAVIVIAGFVTMIAVMVWFEDGMIYYPTRYPDGFWDTDELSRRSGFVVEDCYFNASDGVKLHAWFCRPRTAIGAELPVMLWFHGNAGNLSHRGDLMLAYAGLEAEVLLVDYRGYGRCEGKPSEDGLYLDGRAAWRFLTGERGIAPERIVIFGESLGGAVAVNLASQVEPSGLMLVSTFTSVPDMAARHFPFIPRFLVRTKMDSESLISKIECPKLIMHGNRDEVVPFKLGKQLFEAAAEPKRWVEIPGAHHNDLWMVGGKRVFDEMREFLHACVGTGN